MAVPADDRDLTRLLATLRQEIAQNRTDIQRLWRLVAREVHEPFFVIGGDAPEESSSGGGSSASGPPFPPPDNTDPPAGGPDPSEAVADHCCLWMWTGNQWEILVDNTSGCTCPPPDDPGARLFETAITCCFESSSGSSSGSACAVGCHGCSIPCTLLVTVTKEGGGGVEIMDQLLGSHALAWNGTKWLSGCIGTGNETITGQKIRATCSHSACKLAVAIEYFFGGGCANHTAADTLTSCDPNTWSCEPIFGEFRAVQGGATYVFTVTEA